MRNKNDKRDKTVMEAEAEEEAAVEEEEAASEEGEEAEEEEAFHLLE